MGLHKQYLKVGQNARDHIFGIPKNGRSGTTPLSLLISQGAKINNGKYKHQNKNFFIIIKINC